MRVVVAPDAYGSELSAAECAEAVARGWARTAPGDELVLLPLSDGGAGFVDAVGRAVEGRVVAVALRQPSGAVEPGSVLLADDGTAFVEAVQGWRDGSTRGVGQLVRAAVELGAATVVVGVGRVPGAADGDLDAGLDGGRGLLQELGAEDEDGEPVGLGPCRDVLAGSRLVVATASDVVADPAHGPDLAAWGRLLASRAAADLVRRPGSGAGGGTALALLALGAERVSAVQLMVDRTGLAEQVRGADLVLTAERTFDATSLRGSVVAGVAHVAGRLGRPVVVLAGSVLVGRREMAAVGVESAYGAGPGAPDAAADAALEALARRVARTWSY